MDSKKFNTVSIIVVIFLVILFSVSAFQCTAYLNRSKKMLKASVQERMLEIAQCAAATINGDILKSIQASNEDSPAYQAIMSSLSVYRDNIDLEYIYCVREAGDHSFIFTIDPTISDYAEFGEPVAYTDALYMASKGIASVDDEPYTDRWGAFYSAYAPVFDSAGKVAGIVCVDFSVGWYESKLDTRSDYVYSIIILMLILAIPFVLFMYYRLRVNMYRLGRELFKLSLGVKSLTNQIQDSNKASDSSQIRPHTPKDFQGEVMSIGNRLSHMQNVLKDYLAYIHTQAYTDAMTGVGNKTAYIDLIHKLDKKISENSTRFSIIVLDVNGLKSINDNFGHEQGDMVISDAAEALKRVFTADRVYRIGGDEFIIVLNLYLQRKSRNFSAI